MEVSRLEARPEAAVNVVSKSPTQRAGRIFSASSVCTSTGGASFRSRKQRRVRLRGEADRPGTVMKTNPQIPHGLLT